MVELQGSLESKNASLSSLSNDLKVAEDQYNRLMGKVEEMQNTVASRDNTGEWWRPRELSVTITHISSCVMIYSVNQYGEHPDILFVFLLLIKWDFLVTFAVQDLRQQMGGLQSQLQQVQLERSTLQNRLKTSQAEIDSLQQVRQWYQQQLALAQEARVRLQSEMANMQVRLMLMWLVFISKLEIWQTRENTFVVFFPLPGWTDDSDWCRGTSEAGECDSVTPTHRDPTSFHQRQRAHCCSAAEHWGILYNIPHTLVSLFSQGPLIKVCLLNYQN